MSQPSPVRYDSARYMSFGRTLFLGLSACLMFPASCFAQESGATLPPAQPSRIIHYGGPSTLVIAPINSGDARTAEALLAIRQAITETEVREVPVPPLLEGDPRFRNGACRTLACASELRAAVNADVVIRVTVADGRRLQSVAVSISGRSLLFVASGESTETRERLQTAAAASFRMALEQWRAGGTRTVTIDCEPADSQIRINGGLVGTAPLTIELPVGSYQVEAASPGYVRHNQSLELTPDSEPQLRLHLIPDGRSGETPQTPGVGESTAHYWVGGAFVALSLGLAILPILTLARDGECIRTTDSVCSQRIESNEGTALLLVGSGVSLAAGIASFAITF